MYNSKTQASIVSEKKNNKKSFKCNFIYVYLLLLLKPANAAMHGPHSLVRFGPCGPCIAALAGY